MAEALLAELAKGIGSQVVESVVLATDIDSKIKRLHDLKNTIEATLLDADSSPQNNTQRDTLEKLDRELNKLIDFQDAKETKAKQKEVMGGSKLTKEVHKILTFPNKMISTFKDARKIKAINEELNLVVRNHAHFGSIISSSSTTNQNRSLCNESGSYTCTDMVIGRNVDIENMVSLLLDNSSAAGIISVAPIVGIGGVGKTTLAQCVYNDKRIRNCFDLQLWVPVSQEFSVKDVLRKMVACATDEDPLNCHMDQLQRRLFRAIAGKRFLLVLDSVWDQDSLREKWLDLLSLLRCGGQGSQVVVTTRSDTVARVMGTQDPYMVSDLGDDDSWTLFQHVAFTRGCESELELEAIGMEIAKMCPRVPLVIRAIGSILAGRHTIKEWRAFRDNKLTNFASYGRDVMNTLKHSYDELGSALKRCVLYCSLFPKGYKFQKDELTWLWIALGYVEQEYTNQSQEDVAEGYVLRLLQRGFFYFEKRDRYECPNSFQMHNLMHDLVLSIAGFKYKLADLSTTEFDERVCHVSYHLAVNKTWEIPSSLFKIKQLKSFLLPLPNPGVIFTCLRVFLLQEIFIPRVKSLRVLRMHGIRINKLPRSVGELIHLRYLDLSDNPIDKLPDSITRLVNLYLLNLSRCTNLEELPKDISKLVMLRHLDLDSCDNLSHMPKGLLRLTGLETLNHFVVGKPNKSLSLSGCKSDVACGLADLNGFDKLKGRLKIDLIHRSKDVLSEAEAANLGKKEKIVDFSMRFRESTIEDEMLLDSLKPGGNLCNLYIENYGGKRLPRWMREGVHVWLPNLVRINIFDCKGCIYLCSFGRLPHLRYLSLEGLDKVEYIENTSSSNNDNTIVLMNEQLPTPLFPALEHLILNMVPALKGWWSVTDFAQDQGLNQLVKQMPAFPKLKTVRMDMELLNTLAIVSLLKSYVYMVRELHIRYCQIKVLPKEFRDMSYLEWVRISSCEYIEAIPEWIDSLTSLSSLHIFTCPRLKSLPQGISNLPNLQSLRLHKCSKQLAERCQATTGEDWPKIQHIPNISIIPVNDDEF